MIPKLAIEKAISGEWTCFGAITDASKMDAESRTAFAKHMNSLMWQEIALDPTFWQALEKALGWEPTHPAFQASWVNNAHRFYALILQGKDTEAFWQQLLQGN